MTPEEEYKRGLRYMARGRQDLAEVRFERARQGGVNVLRRLLREPLQMPERVGRMRPDPSAVRSQELFKALVDAKPRDFEKGKSFVPQATERQLVEDQRPVVTATEGQSAFDVPAVGEATPVEAAAIFHPFQITINAVAGTASVTPNSVIWRNLLNFTTTVTVTGLGSDFAVVSGTWIYLAGTVSGVTITGCAVMAAASLPARTTFSGTAQTAFTYPLGQIITSGAALVVNQHCHANLSILNVCIAGNGALYPIQL